MSEKKITVARYVVDEQATSLELVQGRVARGTIIRSGAVLVLACPVCTKIQFTPHALSGPAEAPTVAGVIHCGAGYCKRCGVHFRIDAGVPVLCDPPEPGTGPTIPDALRAAGVTRPPAHPARRMP